MTLGLFTREVRVATLASGSSGNCTYVGDRHGGVLVDCGVSTRQILGRLGELGLADSPISAVLITHEHTDHVGAAAVLSRRLKGVPFFMTRGTRAGVDPRCMPEAVETLDPGTAFRLGAVHVDCFTVPHDTRDPVGYRVRVGSVGVAVITDLGRPTALVAQVAREVDVLVLEFNHDVEMLMEGPYPWHLKQRIRSNHGHLSNDQAASLLRQALTPRLRHLVLAHLSQENNTPARAMAAARRILREAGADHVEVTVAEQFRPIGPLRLVAEMV